MIGYGIATTEPVGYRRNALVFAPPGPETVAKAGSAQAMCRRNPSHILFISRRTSRPFPGLIAPSSAHRRKRRALVHFVSTEGAPASSDAGAFVRRPRLARSSDGGNMQPWTIAELTHLTRDELCNLADRIARVLPDLEAGTVERINALTSLDNIRRVMIWRGLHY